MTVSCARIAARLAHLQVNIRAAWDILEVRLEDLSPALDIWVGDSDMPIKASRPHQSLVQGLWEIRGRNADDAFAWLEPAEMTGLS